MTNADGILQCSCFSFLVCAGVPHTTTLRVFCYFVRRPFEPLSGCARHCYFSDGVCPQQSSPAFASCVLVPAEVCSCDLEPMRATAMRIYSGLIGVAALSSTRSLNLCVQHDQQEYMPHHPSECLFIAATEILKWSLKHVSMYSLSCSMLFYILWLHAIM